jgi:hypothetical protein
LEAHRLLPQVCDSVRCYHVRDEAEPLFLMQAQERGHVDVEKSAARGFRDLTHPLAQEYVGDLPQVPAEE